MLMEAYGRKSDMHFLVCLLSTEPRCCRKKKLLNLPLILYSYTVTQVSCLRAFTGCSVWLQIKEGKWGEEAAPTLSCAGVQLKTAISGVWNVKEMSGSKLAFSAKTQRRNIPGLQVTVDCLVSMNYFHFCNVHSFINVLPYPIIGCGGLDPTLLDPTSLPNLLIWEWGGVLPGWLPVNRRTPTLRHTWEI